MGNSQKRTKRDRSPDSVKNAGKPLWAESQNIVPKRSIGYVRVSKTSQTVQQQTDALKKAGVVAIFGDEGISGSRRARPGLDAALADLRAGDVLCVIARHRIAAGSNTKIHQIRPESIFGLGVAFASKS